MKKRVSNGARFFVWKFLEIYSQAFSNLEPLIIR
jgi:hypothetical protein